MVFSSLRVACAELLCLTLLASHLVAPTLLFADEEALIVSPTSLLAPDVSVQTIDSSLTAAVLTSSGVPEILLYTGSTILSSVSEILPSLQKQDQMISETSEPISDHLNQNEILIQFKEASVDLDTYAGKYQLDQIENSHDLTTTDTLSDENIAVMKIDVLSKNLLTEGSIANKDTINFEIEKTVDTTIAELKKDPRVARVQRNFVYKLSTSSTRAIQSSRVI